LISVLQILTTTYLVLNSNLAHRGSQHTDTQENSDKLINECIETALRNLYKDNQQRPTPTADCDAFSFILVFQQNYNSAQKKALLEFFKFFGSFISEVSIPSSPVAMKTKNSYRKDQIFGSDFVIDECLHELFYESESLVISSPVKIAVHESCEGKMKDQIDKLGFHLTPSSTQGVCFKSTHQSPTFGAIVNAILSDASIPAMDERHIIHVANLGTRYPIDKKSRDDFLSNCPCTVRRLFKKVQTMREAGIEVLLTQLDIAVNIPNPLDFLPQWSRTPSQTRETEVSHVFANVEYEEWALHDITSNPEKPLPDNHQHGSLRIKQKGWSNESTILVFGEEESFADTHHSTSVETLRNIYQVDQDQVDQVYEDNDLTESVHIDTKCAYSAKLYSSIAHYVMKDKWRFALHRGSTQALPSRNMLYLQRMIKAAADLLDSSLETAAHSRGVDGRVEISIRPTRASELLRSKGHFTDLMFHALLGFIDVFEGKQAIGIHHNLSYDVVAIQCKAIITSIQQVVAFRSQKIFKDIFPGKPMHRWLKAMMYLVTTLIGLTHFDKTKALVEWIQSYHESPTNFYDPLGLRAKLQEGHSLYVNPKKNAHSESAPSTSDEETQLKVEEAQCKVISILEDCLKAATVEGREAIRNLVRKQSPSYYRGYINLSLADKQVLASCLTEEAIPRMSLLLFPSDIDAQDNLESTSDNEEFLSDSDEAPNESEYNIPTWAYVDTETALTNSMKESSRMLHQNFNPNVQGKSSESNHPVIQIMSRFSHMSHQFDANTPLFFKRLKFFISKYHKTILKPPDNEMESFLQFKQNTLQDLRVIFQRVFGKPTHLSKSEIIRHICEHYLIPCQGTGVCPDHPRWKFHEDDESLEAVHKLTNEMLTSIEAVELQPTLRSTKRFYRSCDSTHIHIPLPDSLFQQMVVNFEISGDSPDFSDPYCVMSHALYSNGTNSEYDDGSASAVKEMIKIYLDVLPDVPNQFLSPNASNNVSFGSASDFTDLAQTAEGQLFHNEGFKKYHNIILPALCGVTKRDIAFYVVRNDIEASEFHYHYYDKQTAKVVTYDNFGMYAPIRPCVTLLCDGEYKIYKHAQIITLDDRETIHNGENTQTFAMPELFKTNLTTFPDGKPAQSFRNHKSKSFTELVKKALQATEVNHEHFSHPCDDTNDKLDLYPYLEEQFSMSNNSSDFFSDELIAYLDHHCTWYQNSPQNIIDYISSDQNHDSIIYTHIISIVMCLKYKLWICIWFEDSGRGSCSRCSYFYWFDPIAEKVSMKKFTSFTKHTLYSQIIYFRVKHLGRKITTMCRWSLPVHNPYNQGYNTFCPFNHLTLLSTKFSFIQRYTMTDVMDKINSHYNGNISYDHKQQTIQVNTNTPSISLFGFVASEFAKASDPNTQITLRQHALAIVFHKDLLPDSKNYFTHVTHHSMSDNQLQIEAGIFMNDRVFSLGHITRSYMLAQTNISSFYDPGKEISPSFIFILHSCLASIFKEPDHFLHAINQLCHVDDMKAKTKHWITDAAIDLSQLEFENFPDWLQKICISTTIKFNLSILTRT
jgi:hypothetical protein